MQFLIVLLIVFGLAYSIRVPIQGGSSVTGGVANRGAFNQGGRGSNQNGGGITYPVFYAPGRGFNHDGPIYPRFGAPVGDLNQGGQIYHRFSAPGRFESVVIDNNNNLRNKNKK